MTPITTRLMSTEYTDNKITTIIFYTLVDSRVNHLNVISLEIDPFWQSFALILTKLIFHILSNNYNCLRLNDTKIVLYSRRREKYQNYNDLVSSKIYE